MVSVHFQVERIWIHLGHKYPGIPVKDYLVSGHACERSHYKVNGGGKACLSIGSIPPWPEILGCVQKRECVEHSIHHPVCWLCMQCDQMLQEKKELIDKT